MNGLTVDRSGRTLEDYRELYWQKKARVKELEAENARMVDATGREMLESEVIQAAKRKQHELEERLKVEQSCNYCGQYHGKEVCQKLLDRIAKLEAQLDAVKPYLRHSDLCVTKEAEAHELHMESRCTCGLRKALEQGGVCSHGSG
jgi:predicted Zn-dependent protease with MMP-like domain